MLCSYEAPTQWPFCVYRGKVTKRATEADRKKHEGVNMLVKFSNNETSGVLPGCLGAVYTGPDAEAEFRLGITADTWGVDRKWVQLQCPETYVYAGAKREKKGKGKGKGANQGKKKR